METKNKKLASNANEIIEGGLDDCGREVESVIGAKDDSYAIYLIKNEYIDVGFMLHFTPDDHIQKVLGKINSITSSKPFNSRFFSFVREMTSQALHICLTNNDSVVPLEILVKLETKLNSTTKVLENFIYILFGGSLLLFFIVLSFLIHCDLLPQKLQDLEVLIYSMTISGVGSFLFQLININNSKNELHNLIIYGIRGFIKMLFGLITGFFIYIVIYSNLILGIFKQNHYAIFCLAFIAGFNEKVILKIIDNLVSKVDSSLEEPQTNTKEDVKNDKS